MFFLGMFIGMILMCVLIYFFPERSVKIIKKIGRLVEDTVDGDNDE